MSYQKLVKDQRRAAHDAMLQLRGSAVEKLAPLCINCASYSAGYDFTYGKFQHRCHEPLLRDPVTGGAVDAALKRQSGIGCGPNGSFFKLKQNHDVHREIEVKDEGEPMEYKPPVPFALLAAPPTEEPACFRYRRSGNSSLPVTNPGRPKP